MRKHDDYAGCSCRKNRCTRCGEEQTWATTRASFGRMMRKGFTVEAAKQHSPICSRCVTQVARENKAALEGGRPLEADGI
jgi:hypothetical protein